MSDLLRTEILSSVWEDREFVIFLPALFREDQIFLDFEIGDFGKIRGLFEVVSHLHCYNASRSVPYTQRVTLEPVE